MAAATRMGQEQPGSTAYVTPGRPAAPASKHFPTPRTAGGHAGNFKQTQLRRLIAKQMKSDMLQCPLDEFLKHYAPFCPSPQSVETALQQFKDWNTYKKDDLPGKDGKAREDWVLDNFEEAPSTVDQQEEAVFSHLQDIVNALGRINYLGQLDDRKNVFFYRDCPRNQMKSEIPGCNFKVDACITRPSDLNSTGDNSNYIISAETAVVAEYKKSTKNIEDNRLKVVSAANHIMNDDPCRMWMYGITIEDTTMAVWYFSRSHSVKSEGFDFTKDVEAFIQVFISFLYATPLEMGYDPTVHRVDYEGKLHYVYEVGTPSSIRYFRTVEPLFNPRVLRITGRKTRVWRAVEVEGYNGALVGKIKGDGREVAIKDVWLDEGSQTEGQNQMEVFKRLRGVKKDHYAWAPLPLQLALDHAFEKGYQRYFMEILCDSQFRKTRAPSLLANPAPEILHFEPREPGEIEEADRNEEAHPVYDKNLVEYSTQTTGFSGLPTNIFMTEDSQDLEAPERAYKAKQQYRLVYNEVGHSLDMAENLTTSFNAILDVFVALVLLYLAGWVHRDISAANIILVKMKDGSFRGKLSDLEYAKDSKDTSSSTDPKTGTPYFMPIEIHSGIRLCQSRSDYTAKYKRGLDPFLTTVIEPIRRHKNPSPLRPKFQFQHDLESLWWIMVWILIDRVDHLPARKFSGKLFQYTSLPSHARERFFRQNEVTSSLGKHIHPKLGTDDIICPIHDIQVVLWNSYLTEGPADASTFSGIYAEFWEILVVLVVGIRAITGVNFRNSRPKIMAVKRKHTETTKVRDDAEYELEEDEEDAMGTSKRQKMDAHPGGLAPRKSMRHLG